MLTLITGLPGNGKTLYALQYIFDWVKRETTVAHPEPRPVYYHGVNSLKPELGWHQLDTKDERINGDKNPPVAVPQWWKCPARSIILIDEAQNCGFGTRARGLAPEWSKLLETHRHLGVDIVIVTQSPTLIDPHDRALAELHFHVMRSFGMQRAVVHEFRPVRLNVAASRKGSIEHRWSYPKHVFEWYVSAEAHTHKRRIPMRVVVLLLLPFLIISLGWFAWAKYLSPSRDGIKAKQGDASATGTVARIGTGGPAGGRLETIEYLKQHVPRVEGLAYTAPIYDDVTKAVEAPYPAACVSSSTRCQCFSQQGTRLETPAYLCKSIVAGGFFVAWKQPGSKPALMPRERPQTGQQEPNGGPAIIGHTRPAEQPSSSILDKDQSSPNGGRGKNLPPLPVPSNGPLPS